MTRPLRHLLLLGLSRPVLTLPPGYGHDFLPSMSPKALILQSLRAFSSSSSSNSSSNDNSSNNNTESKIDGDDTNCKSTIRNHQLSESSSLPKAGPRRLLIPNRRMSRLPPLSVPLVSKKAISSARLQKRDHQQDTQQQSSNVSAGVQEQKQAQPPMDMKKQENEEKKQEMPKQEAKQEQQQPAQIATQKEETNPTINQIEIERLLNGELLALSIDVPLFPGAPIPIALGDSLAFLGDAIARARSSNNQLTYSFRVAVFAKQASESSSLPSEKKNRSFIDLDPPPPRLELLRNIDSVYRFGVMAILSDRPAETPNHRRLFAIPEARIWLQDLIPTPKIESSPSHPTLNDESLPESTTATKSSTAETVATEATSATAPIAAPVATAPIASVPIVPTATSAVTSEVELSTKTNNINSDSPVGSNLSDSNHEAVKSANSKVDDDANAKLENTIASFNAIATATLDHYPDISFDSLPSMTQTHLRSLDMVISKMAMLSKEFDVLKKRTWNDSLMKLTPSLAAHIASTMLVALHWFIYQTPETVVARAQGVLETVPPNDRLAQVLMWADSERVRLSLQDEMRKEMAESVQKRNMEASLKAQMKMIEKKLGLVVNSRIDSLLKKVIARGGVWPLAAKLAFDKEIKYLSEMEHHAGSEAQSIMNYLEHVTDIPWGHRCPEKLDPSRVRQVLDEDHYGLEDVKNRIEEFVAIGKLRGSIRGKTLCFVGPPGVGKTSIGKSIARALDRPLYTLSVGGLHDISEIKGHRRTYMGAMPGKVIQALKLTGVENPVIILDEIDKIVDRPTNHGNPAAALLDLLDPEQNTTFTDIFLDIPIDLSHVLFICTANTTETLSAPLLDRMEIIQVPSYVTEEKLAIAERHLIPQVLFNSGLQTSSELETKSSTSQGKHRHHLRWRIPPEYETEEIYKRDLPSSVYSTNAGKNVMPSSLSSSPSSPSSSFPSLSSAVSPPSSSTTDAINIDRENMKQEISPHQTNPSGADRTETSIAHETDPDRGNLTVTFKQDAIRNLIERYCRESGVRSLKRHIEKICGKIVRRYVQSGMKSEKIEIVSRDLVQYVGPPIYVNDHSFYEEHGLPAGVATGLAYTSHGGGVLFIESTLDSALTPDSKAGISFTGSLGSVMKESASIAYTVAKSILTRKAPENKFFHHASLHMHLPEGAVSKEGPSAGITMTTSLLSLALDCPIPNNLAMTGEVTLSGRVLRVGGIREKVTGAKRVGITRIILPSTNRAEWDELPDLVKRDIEPIFCETYDEIFRIAFEKWRADVIRDMWWTKSSLAPLPSSLSSSSPSSSSTIGS